MGRISVLKLKRKSILIFAGIALVILILTVMVSVIFQSTNLTKFKTTLNTQTNGDPSSQPNEIHTSKVTAERIENPNQQSNLSKPNGSAVVEMSQKYIGVPYAPGGVSPSGFDSSGFVQYVYKQCGSSLPRSTADIFNLGTKVTDLLPGDLVFFNTSGSGVSHVGIYIGNGKFISTTVNKGVKIDLLQDSYWGSKYMGAKRL